MGSQVLHLDDPDVYYRYTSVLPHSTVKYHNHESRQFLCLSKLLRDLSFQTIKQEVF